MTKPSGIHVSQIWSEHLQDPPALIKFTVSLLYVQKKTMNIDDFKVDFHGFSMTDFPMFFGPAMDFRRKSLRRLVLLAPLALLRPALFALPEEQWLGNGWENP